MTVKKISKRPERPKRMQEVVDKFYPEALKMALFDVPINSMSARELMGMLAFTMIALEIDHNKVQTMTEVIKLLELELSRKGGGIAHNAFDSREEVLFVPPKKLIVP